MPNRQTQGKFKLWSNLPSMQKWLIASAIIIIIIAIILFSIMLKRANSPCDTTSCINEAAKIAQRIDPKIHPCDDFYNFACGKYLESAHGDEGVILTHQLRNQRKEQLLALYLEDIKDGEHKMVKLAKNLFRTCTNQSKIEPEALNTIKAVLQEIGGWPVLEGDNWSEDKFDWREATYKLRELGYTFTILFDVSVMEDKEQQGKYILSVTTPYWHKYNFFSEYFKEEAINVMTHLVKIFKQPVTNDTGHKIEELFTERAEDIRATHTEIVAEITEAYEFLKNIPFHDGPLKMSVSQYQENFKSMDWLNFLNNIIGPKTSISSEDYVSFQKPEYFSSWLTLISETPKRVLANYMAFVMIIEQLQYLSEQIRHVQGKSESRTDFCFKVVEKRFNPSPMEIMFNRRYIPTEKKRHVEDVVAQIKMEIIATLNEANLTDTEKNATVSITKTLEIVVGQYGNYFDDAILDDLDTDIVETKGPSFLAHLAQANRNFQSNLYKNINRSTKDAPHYMMPYAQDIFDAALYNPTIHTLYIPGITIQQFSFQRNRPCNYFIYAILASRMSYPLVAFFYNINRSTNDTSSVLSNATKDLSTKFDSCIIKNQVLAQNSALELRYIQHQTMMDKFSYAAYRKCTEKYGKEKKLLGSPDYITPEQLFWIFATECYILNKNKTGPFLNEDPAIIPMYFAGAKRNNRNFANDFQCPVGSAMNPAINCDFFF